MEEQSLYSSISSPDGRRAIPHTAARALGGNILAVGRQDRLATTRGETCEAPGYAVLNLQAGFRPYPGFLIRFGVQNVGDIQYHNHLNAKNPFTGVSIPEPGRSLFIRTTYSF